MKLDIVNIFWSLEEMNDTSALIVPISACGTNFWNMHSFANSQN